MPTVITKSIGSAVGRDYATITLWEDARGGDLVTRDTIEKGECYKDSVFSEAITIAGSITDANHYMWLTVAEGQRHTGKEGTGVVVSPPGISHGIVIQNNYTIVEWLELTNWGGGLMKGISIQAHYCKIRFNLIHDERDTNQSYSIEYSGYDYNEIYRNIIYETGTPSAFVGIMDGNGWRTGNKIFNNTVHNFVQYCIQKSAGSINGEYKNNCATNGGAGCYLLGSAAAAANNNLSSDATAPGTSPQLNKPAANQYASLIAPYDLRLKDGADCINNGANLGSPYDISIRGAAVTEIWDISADELPPPVEDVSLFGRGIIGAAWIGIR